MRAILQQIPSVLDRRPLVALVGPTAVGKSAVALHVARALETEILTADSRQVYRRMDIATDKPSPAARRAVPHRLLDLVEPDEPFNAGMYRRFASAEIERLYASRRLPFVVGGTGLYVRALLYGLWEGPTADWGYRERLEREAQRYGAGHLHRELARIDPETAGRLHPHDEVKIIRALEVHHLSGRRLSEAHEAHRFRRSEFSALLLGLTRERQALYRRIDARVDAQLAAGLVEETQRLLAAGYGRGLSSMKGLGYRQIAGHLAGEYDLDEAVRRLKRDTRRFAKRQLTWFRKEPELRWVTITEGEHPSQVAERVLEAIARFVTTGSGASSAVRPAVVA